MALSSGIKRQLRSVIQWEEPGPDELFFEWTENGDEIKNASQLIVGPGQGCIFVYEGQLRAVHTREGMIELQTDNIPFWTTVTKVMQAFQSEHKVGIYFFTRRRIVDQKWGTVSPVKYEEPKYGIPAALRAHGNYSFELADPAGFFRALVGSNQLRYRISDLRAVLADRLSQTIADVIAEARPGYLDIDAQRGELAAAILARMAPEFAKLGLKALDFRIEGADFDDETRARVRRIGDAIASQREAQAVEMTYADRQKLEALRDAARNEGGAAGLGMSLGAGLTFGNTMANALGAMHSSGDAEKRLKALAELREKGLLSEEEFRQKRQSILDGL